MTNAIMRSAQDLIRKSSCIYTVAPDRCLAIDALGARSGHVEPALRPACPAMPLRIMCPPARPRAFDLSPFARSRLLEKTSV